MKEVTLKLEGVKELPKKGNYEYTYVDENGNKIIFIETNKPFTYLLDLDRTSDIYAQKKIINRAIEAYIKNSINRSDFAGGYKEAISQIKIKI
jgi:hypothetical protein